MAFSVGIRRRWPEMRRSPMPPVCGRSRNPRRLPENGPRRSGSVPAGYESSRLDVLVPELHAVAASRRDCQAAIRRVQRGGADAAISTIRRVQRGGAVTRRGLLQPGHQARTLPKPLRIASRLVDWLTRVMAFGPPISSPVTMHRSQRPSGLASR